MAEGPFEASPTLNVDESVWSQVRKSYVTDTGVGGKMLRLTLFLLARVQAGESLETLKEVESSAPVQTIVVSLKKQGFSDLLVAAYMVRFSIERLAGEASVKSPCTSGRKRARAPDDAS
jgi:hypothetical protein